MRTVGRFSAVDPTERNHLTFVFTDGLTDGEIIISATATVSIVYGLDPDPESLIQGALYISGNHVMVPFGSPKNNVDYLIRVTAETSNAGKILALGKILPCRKQ